ncbi:activating signal cointegrator 1 complex subunit 2-like [Acanthaster planci]|uniref:Activating signal cointegrator 1 complex subunit 2-like n=1 Tax=Acanthaster planci TaxID=133434 RepID=A0A8B7Z583_ACAPL|nr:activating signal cointegrator 1 complex subunit 2-like [Acanthaster planci]
MSSVSRPYTIIFIRNWCNSRNLLACEAVTCLLVIYLYFNVYFHLEVKMAATQALDEHYITVATGGHGTKVTKPALDSCWMEEVEFLVYQPPPPEGCDAASREEWQEMMGYIEEDLHWLLKLPHHKFWSQVVYDHSLQQCLDSYLREAPRTFDPMTSLPDDFTTRQRSVHKLVFLTFLRMATCKETKESFITPSVFGDIIYENFLFDIAKLMELCVLYGGGNSDLLAKMVGNIFKNQPKYKDDLIAVIPTIVQCFDNILEKCGLKAVSDTLPEAPQARILHTMPDNELGDIIHYLTDSALSILSFLEIYPEGAWAFHKHSFVLKVAAFVETFLPALERAMKERQWAEPSKKKLFQKHLKLGKVSLARVCQCIVTRCYIQPIVEGGRRMTFLGLVEDYLELMSSLLSDKHFLSVFARQYHIGEDLDVVLQKAHVDETRAQFIFDGFRNAATTHHKDRAKHDGTAASSSVEAQRPDGIASCQYGLAPEDFQTDEYIEQLAPSSSGACGGGVSEVEMLSLISSVKDLFPDYGEGFIEACLEEYSFDTTKVIHAILEDKLVPGLQELDKTMARTAKPQAAMKPGGKDVTPAGETSLLQQRSNIFQNDEFDIFSRDTVDTSRIHKGKRDDRLSDQKLQKDKTHLARLVSSCEEYNYEYEDEYDDTYDANDVGADDADSADELTSRRPFMVPRVLRGGEESSSGEEDDQDTEPPPPNETRDTQAPHNRQHASRGGGRRGGLSDAVKGQSKGQGQSKETQRARGFKDRNKSSRANHNRKAMADKKRSKGMGPLS